jgi:YVTN family beta-propeller protein
MNRHLLKVFLLFLATTIQAVEAKPLVYVAAGSANKILIIDPALDKVVGQFDNIDNPHSVVSTPDGEYLLSGSLMEKPPAPGETGTPHSTIYKIHPDHGHVMLTMNAEGMIHHQTITPDGRYVVSTHPGRGNISVVDMQQNKVVQYIPTGPAPNYAVVTPDGKLLYVSNSGNGTISEIDIQNWKVIRTLDGGPGPEHIVLSKDASTLYVLNPGAGELSMISIATGKVAMRYKIGQRLHGLDISDDGSTLFISSKGDKKLIALNPKLNTQNSLSLSPSPYHLETITGTGKIYVSSSTAPIIWVVDQQTLKLLGKIQITGEGHQMTLVQ